jgi:hypothetical protein
MTPYDTDGNLPSPTQEDVYGPLGVPVSSAPAGVALPSGGPLAGPPGPDGEPVLASGGPVAPAASTATKKSKTTAARLEEAVEEAVTGEAEPTTEEPS